MIYLLPCGMAPILVKRINLIGEGLIVGPCVLIEKRYSIEGNTY